MFKTSNLSGSSDEESSNDEQQVMCFISNYNSIQMDDGSSSNKSDEDDADNEGTTEFNLQPKASTKEKLPPLNHFSSVNRPKKRPHSEDNDNYGETVKSKSKYVFNDDITNLITSKNVPIQEDNKGRMLIERMGYKSGQGLGKHAQGRVDPVELPNQRGRRGLGLTLPGLDPASLQWDSSYEVVDVKEELSWLKGDHSLLDIETLRSWKSEGPKDMNIEKMTDFCDEKLLSSILKGKNVFDNLSSNELNKARARSNPFETLRNGIFLNRAALKMANIDARCDFMFTSPKNDIGETVVNQNQLLYFADVCAGPGGFSEYVLWRKGWLAKGFGFTLKGDCDFRLCDFCAGTPETFEPFYGANDDGDIFNPENIHSFTDAVMKGTDGKGVHFMMADGGFSVEGKENYQEILSKQLYLCQFLVSLCIVRNEGNFVCKLFDLFSPFSAGLVYLMYRAFKEISIFKPNTSRPANSERYILCKHKRHDCSPIRDYMFEMCERLWELDPKSNHDITHCVPLSVLKDDDDFMNYLVDSNNRLGERQVINLMKIAAFCRDPNLTEGRQSDLKKSCLSLWEVPDGARLTVINKGVPEEEAKKSGFINSVACLSMKTTTLTPNVLSKFFTSLYDWHCIPLGSTELHLYLGLGRNKIFRWDQNDGGNWKRETRCNADLSPGTIIYGEIVPELIGEGRSQKKRFALHVVDAISLGYKNISDLHYKDRLNKMNLYSVAIKKQDYKESSPVRIKKPVAMGDLNEIFEGLSVRYSKSGQRQLMLENDEYWFQPKGILFVNSTKAPWGRFLSKSTNYHYYYHPQTRASVFDQDRPPDVNANTLECIKKEILWLWEEGVGLQNESPVSGVVHKDDLLNFINTKLNV